MSDKIVVMEMFMKKILLIFMLIFSLVLCGCGGNDIDTQGGISGDTANLESNETEAHTTDANNTDANNTDADKKPAEPQSVTISENMQFVKLYSVNSDVKYGFTVKGANSTVKIILPSTVVLRGDLTIDNCVLQGSSTIIYANGYRLNIGKNVTSSSFDDRLTVYGGSNTSIIRGNTDISLLGGNYKAVYGGGKGKTVSGDTNVVFGGNANINDSNDDASDKISPCTVYGGGDNAGVGGTVNVTIRDSAVAKFVSGVGSGTGGANVKKTNINIMGGKLMNVFGGSLNSNVIDISVNITVSGGLTEAVFGGCQGKNMSGTVDIKLIGGDISRRVYTGCYNNCDVGFFSDTWTTHCKVTGTTTLSIGPNAKLATKTGLSSENRTDMGIFCGSRYESAMSGENNILVFLDGCYDSMYRYIGPSQNSYWDICESHHSQIIKR